MTGVDRSDGRHYAGNGAVRGRERRRSDLNLGVDAFGARARHKHWSFTRKPHAIPGGRTMTTDNLDHSAATPARAEVLEAMWPFFAEAFGNPSSVHSGGAMPREAVERARAGTAAVLGCRPAEIVFTAGGTEADNLAVIGVARA